MIKLKSSDGVEFEIDVEVAKHLGTIRTMLEDCGMNEEEGAVVPVPEIKAAILRRVLEWSEHHKNDAKPIDNDKDKEKRTDDISAWDANFLEVNHGKNTNE